MSIWQTEFFVSGEGSAMMIVSRGLKSISKSTSESVVKLSKQGKFPSAEPVKDHEGSLLRCPTQSETVLLVFHREDSECFPFLKHNMRLCFAKHGCAWGGCSITDLLPGDTSRADLLLLTVTVPLKFLVDSANRQ